MKSFKAKSVLLFVVLAALSLAVVGCSDLIDAVTGGGAAVPEELLDSPSQVEDLKAFPGDGQVILEWKKNPVAEQVDKYFIYRTDDPDNAQIADFQEITDTDELEYTDTSVVNGVEYGYFVRAENATGKGPRFDLDEVVKAKPSSRSGGGDGVSPRSTDVGTISGTATNTSVKEGNIVVAILTGEDESFDLTLTADDGTYSLEAPSGERFFVGAFVDENDDFEPNEGEVFGFNDNDGDGFFVEVGDSKENVDIDITGDLVWEERVASGGGIVKGTVHNETNITGEITVQIFREGGFRPFQTDPGSVDAFSSKDYVLDLLPPGQYDFLVAFIDLNGNGFPDEVLKIDPATGDPVIDPETGDPVIELEPAAFEDNFGQGYDLREGEEVFVDLFLFGFGADTELYGTIEYEGPERGPIQIILQPAGDMMDGQTKDGDNFNQNIVLQIGGDPNGGDGPPPPPPPLPPFFLNEENSEVIENVEDFFAVDFVLFGIPPGEYQVFASMDSNDDGKFDENDLHGQSEFGPGEPQIIHIGEDFSDFAFIQLREPLPVGVVSLGLGSSEISGVVEDENGNPIPRMRLFLHSPGADMMPQDPEDPNSDDVNAVLVVADDGSYSFEELESDLYYHVGADGFSVQFETGAAYENASYDFKVEDTVEQDFKLFRVDGFFHSLDGEFKKNEIDPNDGSIITEPLQPFDEAELALIRVETGAHVVSFRGETIA